MAALLALAGTARPAAAQNLAPFASADSVRMVTGHVVYDRYETPAACVAAARLETRLIWRVYRARDTLPYDPEHDTIPTRATLAARRCAAVAPAETVPRDLRSRMQLQLILGDDSAASATVARRMADASSDRARAGVWSDAVHDYLMARPMRLAAAQAAARALDRIGHSAYRERADAHVMLGSHALQSFDTAAMRRESDALLALAAMLSPAERDEIASAVSYAYAPLAFRYWQFRDPAHVPTLLREFRAAAKRLRGGRVMPPPMEDAVAQLRARFAVPVDTLTGAFWYNAGPSSRRPKVGVVSLYVFAQDYAGDDAGARAPLYAMIRRLHAKYGAALDIVMLAKTSGYFRDTRLSTPADEADAARRYFLDYLELPVTVMMDIAPVTKLPDGRRVVGAVAFERQFPGAPAVVIGRDGRLVLYPVLYRAPDLWGMEAEVNAYIDRAIGS
jgi:hypothetical protein